MIILNISTYISVSVLLVQIGNLPVSSELTYFYRGLWLNHYFSDDLDLHNMMVTLT